MRKNKTLIMNELLEAEDLIKNGLKDKNLYQSLEIISKYLFYEKKKNNFEIFNYLDKFLSENEKDYYQKKYMKILEYYSLNHKKPLIVVPEIDIYQSELDIIEKLDNNDQRSILFVLICVGKYNNIINNNSNEYWSNLSIKQISSLSKIHKSNDKICAIIRELYKLGLITFNRKIENINIKILCINSQKNQKPVLRIKTFENIRYEYENYKKPYKYYRTEMGILERKKK